nr:spore protease YyaC [Cytobacillus praedii]
MKKLQNDLLKILNYHRNREYVIVCIGTDRSTGDSLAPLVGWNLSKMKLENFYVYGTIDDPIHAENLNEKINYINSKHKNAYIIGIDACLGRSTSIGRIRVNDTPLSPGAGIGKNLPQVGECSITGVVNVSGFMEFFVLQNTRLSLVMKMANDISDLIVATDTHLGDRQVEEYKLISKKRNKFIKLIGDDFKKWVYSN